MLPRSLVVLENSSEMLRHLDRQTRRPAQPGSDALQKKDSIVGCLFPATPHFQQRI